MNNKLYFQIIFLSILIMVVQVFIPTISLGNLEIVPDILIIFLTYIGYYHDRFFAIILGFVFGITQDFILQIDLLGAMAFTKSALGYGLGTLVLYKSIWSRNSRMIFIFLMYNFHFIIYYFIKFNGIPISNLLFMKIIIIHSLISFSILFIVDKSLMKDPITAN